MAGKFIKNIDLDLIILVLVCILIGMLLVNCMNTNERYRTKENFQPTCPPNITNQIGVKCENKNAFTGCNPPMSNCTIGQKYRIMDNQWQLKTCFVNLPMIYGIGTDTAIYKHALDGSGSWDKLTIPGVTQIVIKDDTIYGIGTDNAVYKHALYGSGSWDNLTTPGVTQIVIHNDLIYGIRPNNAVYKHALDGSGSWENLTTPGVTQIVIHDDSIYGIGTDNAVYKHALDGSRAWDMLPDISVTQLIIHDDFLYGLGTDATVYKHSLDGSKTWDVVAILSRPHQIVIHNDLFYLSVVEKPFAIVKHALDTLGTFGSIPGTGQWSRVAERDAGGSIKINRIVIY